MKVFFSNLLIADGNLRTDGLVLRLRRDEPVLIFVTMGIILSDAAALKDMWGVKGQAGLSRAAFVSTFAGLMMARIRCLGTMARIGSSTSAAATRRTSCSNPLVIGMCKLTRCKRWSLA